MCMSVYFVLHLCLCVSACVFLCIWVCAHLLLMCPDLCSEKDILRLLLKHHAPVIVIVIIWTAAFFNWGSFFHARLGTKTLKDCFCCWLLHTSSKIIVN